MIELIRNTPRTYVVYYNGYYIQYEKNHYCIIDAYSGEWMESADTVEEAKRSIDLY